MIVLLWGCCSVLISMVVFLLVERHYVHKALKEAEAAEAEENRLPPNYKEQRRKWPKGKQRINPPHIEKEHHLYRKNKDFDLYKHTKGTPTKGAFFHTSSAGFT